MAHLIDTLVFWYMNDVLARSSAEFVVAANH